MIDSTAELKQMNRTLIGSVLFIDIVGYSMRTVPDQLAMKEIFNALVANAVRHVALSDRLLVDTGDGAAIAFLGDPEDALFAALSLRDAIDNGEIKAGEIGFVRIGINLGPLKVVRDLNGHSNMIGDAVNDAQRVMSFAEPGQVLVSHAYYDIISRLSRDYTQLFVYEGTRQDKHVRDHEVYRLHATRDSAELIGKLRDRARERTSPDAASLALGTTTNTTGKFHAVVARGRTQSRTGLGVAAIGALTVVGAVWSWTGTSEPPPAMIAATEPVRLEGVPASVPVITETMDVVGAAPQKAASASMAASSDVTVVPATFTPGAAPQDSMTALPKTSVEAGKESDRPTQPASDKSNMAGKATGNAKPVTAAVSASAAAQEDTAEKVAKTRLAEKNEKTAGEANPASSAAVKQGVVRLAIQPWGEVYVDGSRRGVSPPLKSLKLAPGKHKIEVRNGQFAPHKEIIEVKSDGETTVHYVF